MNTKQKVTFSDGDTDVETERIECAEGGILGSFLSCVILSLLFGLISITQFIGGYDGVWEVVNSVICGILSLWAFYGAVYMFLAFWNPKYDLLLDCSEASHGGTVRVKWFVSKGKSRKNEKLELFLACTEVVKSQSFRFYGNTEYCFCALRFYETADAKLIEQGETEFEVPDNIIPSLDLDGKKIMWSVVLLASRRFRPDTGKSREIVITTRKNDELI